MLPHVANDGLQTFDKIPRSDYIKFFLFISRPRVFDNDDLRHKSSLNDTHNALGLGI